MNHSYFSTSTHSEVEHAAVLVLGFDSVEKALFSVKIMHINVFVYVHKRPQREVTYSNVSQGHGVEKKTSDSQAVLN